MDCLTTSRFRIGYLLALMLPVGLTACEAQDGDETYADIALSTFSKNRVAQEAPVEVRRMLSGGVELDFEDQAPSPDGRYFTDIDWETSDLAVRDLATGETRRVTNQKDVDGYPDGSVFSSDGGRIAYVWDNYLTGYWELRTIGVDGSDMKVHLGGENKGVYPEPEDWSKDGRYVLITLYQNDTDAQIVTVDVATNEIHVIKTLDSRGPSGSFLSPDGRFVAFDLRPEPDSQERDIFIVSSDGTQETTLIQTPDHERLLGWFPDGSGVLFHRSADDSRAIWKLPVQDGRPAGPPELVKDDVWQMTGFGFSNDAYFYGVTVSRRGVQTASFDLETGRMLEGLEPVGDLSGPTTSSGAWSPDGRRLAYLEAGAGETRLIVRSLTGEILQDLPLAIDPILVKVRWTPHGVLMPATSPDGRRGLYLVSPETGEASFVVEGWWKLRWGSVSEDGSKIFMAGRSGVGPIIEHDLVTGMERTMVEEDVRFGPEASPGPNGERGHKRLVSPDGNYIAHLMTRGTGDDVDTYFEIVSLSSGKTHRTEVFSPSFTRATMAWSPDSRYVLFPGRLEGDLYLLQCVAEDGSLRRLMEVENRFFNLSVSPDGRHISMDTGETRREIWRMTFNGGD